MKNSQKYALIGLFIYAFNKNFCHLTYKIDNELLNALYYILEAFVIFLLSIYVYIEYRKKLYKDKNILNIFKYYVFLSLIEFIYTILVYCKLLKFVSSSISLIVILINISTFVLIVFILPLFKGVKKVNGDY